MFLFRITRIAASPDDAAAAFDALTVRETRLGGWVVTTATDGWLSSVSATADEVAVRERAPCDAPGESLTLAETRLSVTGPAPALVLRKPLLGGRQFYYHAGADGSFYAASHARLLRAAGVRLEEDAERLPELYLYRYVTPPRTLFKRVDQMLAGETLRFAFDGSRWRRQSQDLYAPPAPSDRGPADAPDRGYGAYGERNAAALRDAIAALAACPARPHVLMSGGLDSSILFQIARDVLGVTESHSTSYPFKSQREDGDIERDYALTAAEAMGARHEFFAPPLEDYLRGVVDSVAAAEEPVVHLQSVLMMLLFRDGLPPGAGAVVVGQGADGAYGLRLHGKVQRIEARARKYESWRPTLTFGPTLGTLRLASKVVRRGSGLVEAMGTGWRPQDPVDDPRHVLWLLGAIGDAKWIRRNLRASVEQANANRAALMRPFQGRSANDLVSLLDYLGDVSVTQSVWSKVGEAAGKWVYYPFNAPAVLDAAFETPWDVKLAEPKGVLRGVARRVGVPEHIITRPKANFDAVSRRWGMRGGVLEPLVPLAASVFGEAEVRRTHSQEPSGASIFWTMLNHAIWRRLFIDGDSVSSLLADIELGEPVMQAQ